MHRGSRQKQKERRSDLQPARIMEHAAKRGRLNRIRHPGFVQPQAAMDAVESQAQDREQQHGRGQTGVAQGRRGRCAADPWKNQLHSRI